MRRREFLTIVSSTVAWPLAAWAQQPVMPVVGLLHLGSEGSIQSGIKAFRSGLAELGYTEGENIRVLYRFAEGRVERVSELANELVSLDARVIITSGTTAIRATHSAVP